MVKLNCYQSHLFIVQILQKLYFFLAMTAVGYEHHKSA